ncbi:MAG: hypothetical protein VCA18_08720 [Opitutales bacterium]
MKPFTLVAIALLISLLALPLFAGAALFSMELEAGSCGNQAADDHIFLQTT